MEGSSSKTPMCQCQIIIGGNASRPRASILKLVFMLVKAPMLREDGFSIGQVTPDRIMVIAQLNLTVKTNDGDRRA
jgi:hypothetical protein